MSRFALVLIVLAAAFGAIPADAAPRDADVTGVVNINTASETELRELPGIGPAKAQRILETRTKRKFASTDQIMRVKGIGRKTYRKLKPHLAVTGPTTISRRAKTAAAKDHDDRREPVIPSDPEVASAPPAT